MEAFSALLAYMRRIHRWPHKGGALIFSLICAWTNTWVNNGDDSDLRPRSARYDVTVMRVNPTTCMYSPRQVIPVVQGVTTMLSRGALTYLRLGHGWVNTLRPRQNGRHFADDTFKSIFLNKNIRISIKISLKFVLKVPIYNIPALVQIMAWRRPGDKPLSEKWWSVYWRLYASLGLNELIRLFPCVV